MRAVRVAGRRRSPLISAALNVNSEWWSRKGGLRLPRAAVRKYARAAQYTTWARRHLPNNPLPPGDTAPLTIPPVPSPFGSINYALVFTGFM